MFSYIGLEARIPADHPLRPIRKLVDDALLEPSPAFSKRYAREGRPSIPPERLLRFLLLQALYTVRSDPMLMEQLDRNLLFRGVVGLLPIDNTVWDATVFGKNRDFLLDGDMARKFMTCVLNLPQVRGPLSSEHFSVDGPLIEVWASMKSFVPKDGGDAPPSRGGAGRHGRNTERDFHGEKRGNNTHISRSDPDARPFRNGPGKEAKRCHMGHLMTENRNGLIVDARLTEANGATRHSGHRNSVIKRKQIEEPFGWFKTVGGFPMTRHRGRVLVESLVILTATDYNPIGMSTIFAAVA